MKRGCELSEQVDPRGLLSLGDMGAMGEGERHPRREISQCHHYPGWIGLPRPPHGRGYPKLRLEVCCQFQWSPLLRCHEV